MVFKLTEVKIMTTTAIAEKEDGRHQPAKNKKFSFFDISRKKVEAESKFPLEMQLFADRLLQKLRDVGTDGIPAIRHNNDEIVLTLRDLSPSDKFNRKLEDFKQYCNSITEYTVTQKTTSMLLFKIKQK
jgi:hypothetical protein